MKKLTEKQIQTAVDFLIEHIKLDALYEAKSIDEWKNVFEKAKAMEKDQIMRAYMSGEIGEMYELKNTLTAKQYYENNYEKTN